MSRHVDCGQEHGIMDICPLTGTSVANDFQEYNKTNPIMVDDVIYPVGSVEAIERPTKPRAPLKIRQRRKRERTNKAKARR